ncbi:iron ABC transporter permease [Chelativorans sp. M5D2P16]|uniref:ABC transporter permease n=1 Tax=Chelativorans sp. M5D2P16 TaxID=3095678 RepID=UPI002ACAFED1|nr:iron ABC transporter permease [Chelativorans sp. M5D2P16]MDZ5699595.1 iron ABC transporter permease [Chelativorans sp. M5D2P16]
MSSFTLKAPLPPKSTRAGKTRRQRHPLTLAATALVATVVLLPLCATILIALSGTGADWPHLARYVLPQSVATTLHLLVMVTMATAVVGVTCAWLVVAYDFPFRRTLSWALVLPLAVPPYLAAYAYAEFFHYVGPVQSALRALFGYTRPNEYWFPEIRTVTGAAIVISAVTFPYVYLTARVVFIMQGRNVADVARTLGAGPARVFWRVLLPVARPAIIAGVALVLMETVNDFGAVQHLGVETLTLAIYSTWLNRGSLEGAAQIAVIMLFLVFMLLTGEQMARRKQRFHSGRASQMKARPPRLRLAGWRAGAAFLAGLLPVLAGFGIPLAVFGRFALNRLEQFGEPAMTEALATSVLTALATAILAIAAALLLLYTARLVRTRKMALLVRIATIGYAMPGTILALGLLVTLARFDNFIDALAREYAGFSTGLLFTGSATAVVLACAIRFLALAEGAIQAGIEKLPPNLDEAARSLGRTAPASAATVLLPLLNPAILTAGILVFVDTVKELSATIVLRPFGFNTLATYVYENASRGAVEDGAMAALLIIVVAIVPVILLSGPLMRDRDA